MAKGRLHAYHGTRNWQGLGIRPQPAARAEHGPGIYLCTGYATAAKYGKGGRILLFDLDEDLRWLERSTIPLFEAKRAAIAIFGASAGARIGIDLEAHAARVSARLGGDAVDASVFLNLAIDAKVAHGARGVALAAYFASRGIGASLVRQSGEDWIVVFDPSIVTGIVPMTDASIRMLGFDLERIEIVRR